MNIKIAIFKTKSTEEELKNIIKDMDYRRDIFYKPSGEYCAPEFSTIKTGTKKQSFDLYEITEDKKRRLFYFYSMAKRDKKTACIVFVSNNEIRAIIGNNEIPVLISWKLQERNIPFKRTDISKEI